MANTNNLLTPEGMKLILDHEVGGGKKYYDEYLSRPTWPGGQSGVTIGIGYDLGYQTEHTFKNEWGSMLGKLEIERLVDVIGKKGYYAKSALTTGVRDIQIPWDAAYRVFLNVTIPRWCAAASVVFPGFGKLPTNAQAALVSLVFNRGTSMLGSRRVEMRKIRECVLSYAENPDSKWLREIAVQLRAMKRLWDGRGLDGLLRRREDEARLVETNI